MADYNAEIQQNASWEITITVKDANNNPINLTNWTGQSQIKASYDSPTVLASPTVTISDPTNGVVTVSLTGAQTAALEATPTPPTPTNPLPRYDVLIANQGVTQTLNILSGSITVLPGVTHWT